MNIPTPAAVKKLTEDRKAREAEQASSRSSEKDKLIVVGTMPPSKLSSKLSTAVKRNSDRSASSPKGKGSPDRSSNSRRSKNESMKSSEKVGTSNSDPAVKDRTGKSSRSTKSTSKKRVSESERSTSTTPRKNSSTESLSTAPGAKKSFVRPDHLTTRPLKDNEGLQALKKSLEKPARGQFKREYRTNARQSGKNFQNKKENS